MKQPNKTYYLTRTTKSRRAGSVSSVVERVTFNHMVAGSSPASSTIRPIGLVDKALDF